LRRCVVRSREPTSETAREYFVVLSPVARGSFNSRAAAGTATSAPFAFTLGGIRNSLQLRTASGVSRWSSPASSCDVPRPSRESPLARSSEHRAYDRTCQSPLIPCSNRRGNAGPNRSGGCRCQAANAIVGRSVSELCAPRVRSGKPDSGIAAKFVRTAITHSALSATAERSTEPGRADRASRYVRRRWCRLLDIPPSPLAGHSTNDKSHIVS
jgi:hypothetical protein